MLKNEGLEKFIDVCGGFGVTLTKHQISSFLEYKELLALWNKKINLTALTDDSQIMIKHFADSLSVLPYIGENASVIDVGTGAGFPGVPLAIVRPDISVTLLDSLKKRTGFLNLAADKLGLSLRIIYARAEEAAREPGLREGFDTAVSRAVAPLNVLAEYCLPFVRVGGMFLAMKGGDASGEIREAERAVLELGGELIGADSFSVAENSRSIIKILKKTAVSEKYPRRAGIPAKRPLT